MMLRSSLFAGISLAVAIFAVGSSVAAEPGETTDDALLQSLLGEEPEQPAAAPAAERRDSEPATDASDALPAATDVSGPMRGTAERVARSLRDAGRHLTEGRTDEPTRAAQQAAIAELTRLIEAVKSRPPNPNAGTGEQSAEANTGQQSPGQASIDPQSDGDSPPTGAAAGPAGTPGRNREGRADESSDRSPERRDPAELVRSFRSDVVRDAWGHLPQRLRDQLLNAGPDEYLPQYDSLVRKYYESLAWPEERPTEPNR